MFRASTRYRPAAAALLIAAAILTSAPAGHPQEGFATEIRLAVDTSRISAERVRKADEVRLEEALKARLVLFTPRGEGSVKLESPSNIKVRVPLDKVTLDQLNALSRTGYLEIRHFEDLRTSSNPDGRYEVSFLNIQGGKQQDSQVRFFDRKTSKLVPLKDFVEKSPLIVTSADVFPGGASVATGSLFMVVRVPFKPAATRRLESFFKHPGRILGIILDGQPISITAVVKQTKPPRDPRAPKSDDDEREVPQLDIAGGFGSAAEAGYLATVFNTGPLPLPVKVIDTRLVAPPAGT